MAGRGFTVLHIYGTQLRDLRLALPPIKERKAISNFISQNKNLLDCKISALENLLELYEEKRLAVITQAVTKGLNPDVSMKDSGVDWLGDIPLKWKTGRLVINVNSSLMELTIALKTLTKAIIYIFLQKILRIWF